MKILLCFVLSIATLMLIDIGKFMYRDYQIIGLVGYVVLVMATGISFLIENK